MKKTRLSFLCLGLCIYSCFSAPNTGVRENFLGECTNLKVLYHNPDNESTGETISLDDPYMAFHKTPKKKNKSISRLNSEHIPLRSEDDPQKNSSVYLLRDSNHFLQSVQVLQNNGNRINVNIQNTLQQWKQNSPFLILSFADSHMTDPDLAEWSFTFQDKIKALIE